MRIENIDHRDVGGVGRISADVIWEDSDRDPQTLYFEVDAPASDDLEPCPDTFALACLPVAVWWGEQRLQIDGSLCQRFHDGFPSLMECYSGWFDRCRPIAIEPTHGYVATPERSSVRTASFLSGGVDGLATLRANRLRYPSDHPNSIRECVVTFGTNDFEQTADGPVPDRLAAFERQTGRLQRVADETGVELVPVRTNVRLLAQTYECWTSVASGAGICAVSHAMSGRFSRVLFASNGGGLFASPAGTHSSLDNLLSADGVEVRHDQPNWRRLDKLRLLAEWPLALEIMQPCHYVRIPQAGRINCGTCEKCVRTMLGLVAIGRLADADAFESDDVTVADVDGLQLLSANKAVLLTEFVPSLRSAGRDDLANAIERRIRTYWRRARVRRVVPQPVRHAVAAVRARRP